MLTGVHCDVSFADADVAPQPGIWIMAQGCGSRTQDADAKQTRIEEKKRGLLKLTLVHIQEKFRTCDCGRKKWGEVNGEDGEAKDVRDRLKDMYNPTNHTADTQKNGLGKRRRGARMGGNNRHHTGRESETKQNKKEAQKKERKKKTEGHPRPSRRSPRPAPSQDSLSGCLSQTRATQAPQSLGNNNTERRPSDPRARAGADVGVGLVGDRARRGVIKRLGRAGT
jgi:hypothetical protein